MDSLEPLLCCENCLYGKWLSTRCADDHRRFCGAHSVARRAVRMANISWYQQKAKEAQQGRFGGRVHCMEKHKRQGLCLIRVIKDENGSPCTMETSQYQR